MPLKKVVAEFFGTFWLTFGGCGSAVLAAKFFAGSDQIGIGLFGVALAFGLTVLTMAFAIGHISGCHLNPAVTIGLWVGKRFETSGVLPYIVAQVAGAIAASFVLFLIASGKPDFAITDSAGTFATNGYGDYSPSKYSFVSCLAAEVLLTAFFLFVIMGATDRRAPAGLAPIAIGLCLTLIHLIGIPVTNLSVNPARSTGPALVAASSSISAPLTQLWLFWAAPIVGAAAGALAYLFVANEEPASKTV